jgi:hypothetical protein
VVSFAPTATHAVIMAVVITILASDAQNPGEFSKKQPYIAAVLVLEKAANGRPATPAAKAAATAAAAAITVIGPTATWRVGVSTGNVSLVRK